MGNHKFRFSDMMPNAWFYKLKDIRNNHNSSASRYYKDKNVKQKQHVQQHVVKRHDLQQTPSRKSYYFTRTNSNSNSHSKSSSIDSLFPDPPTPSMKMSCWTDRSDSAPPPTPLVELRSDRALPTESYEEKVSWSSSSNYEPRNIVIDIDDTNQLAAKIENSEDFVTIFDLELRPILTKPKSADSRKLKSNKSHETERRQSASKGLKLRKITNSPRIINNGSLRRKSVSSSTTTSALAESQAIVKRSKNPKEDFKKSMVEMIVEHEIKSSNELEELLACYLSLNSDEYHDLIISVFKQIWFQLSNRH